LLALGPLVYFYVLKINPPAVSIQVERPAAFQPLLLEQAGTGAGNQGKCQDGRRYLGYPYFSAIEPGITTAYIYFDHNLPAPVK